MIIVLTYKDKKTNTLRVDHGVDIQTGRIIIMQDVPVTSTGAKWDVTERNVTRSANTLHPRDSGYFGAMKFVAMKLLGLGDILGRYFVYLITKIST